MRIFAAALTFAGAIGCGGPPHPTYSATFTDREIRIESYAKSFRAAEPALVRALTSDTRILERITPKPTQTALAYGSGEWLSRDFADPFLFSDRQTALEHAREAFERVALPTDAALQSEVLASKAAGKLTGEEPLLTQVRLEQNAFRRLLDAEDARLERERTLPHGAAALVRTLLIEWPLSPKPGAMHDLESMIVWRLQNLEESLAPNTLSEAERDDLRDAFAEFAPKLVTMPKARVALVKVRVSLDAMWVTPFATEDERAIEKAITAHVGSPIAFDELDSAFEAAAQRFEAQVTAGASVLDATAMARVRVRAKEILLGAPACLPRVPVRTPLDMAPPEERAWACSLVHALDDSSEGEGEIAADIAWHDAIVVARWAVSTHGPVRAVDAALRRASPLLALSPAELGRLIRMARAEPLRAIASGVAASLLVKDGAAHARERAHRWRGIGDAPLDLIDGMLPTRVAASRRM